MEFYKWDGDLSQLLQNVRDKLNKVAEVKTLYSTNSDFHENKVDTYQMHKKRFNETHVKFENNTFVMIIHRIGLERRRTTVLKKPRNHLSSLGRSSD